MRFTVKPAGHAYKAQQILLILSNLGKLLGLIVFVYTLKPQYVFKNRYGCNKPPHFTKSHIRVTMLKLQKQQIEYFPFQEYHKHQNIEALAEQHGLVNMNTWMLPQILAHYGGWQLVWNQENLVDWELTAKQNITTDWHIGLWRVVTKLKRGSLVKLQGSPVGVNMSALVPIILAGVKRYQQVNYSRWQIDENCRLIAEDLLAAMLCDYPDLGSERLAEIREQGLTIKSGAKAGVVQKATSKWTLTGIQDTEIFTLPRLAQTMLTQIWVANPSLRTNLMVLDPKNWDSMPKPLVDNEIFVVPGNTQPKPSLAVDLPWN